MIIDGRQIATDILAEVRTQIRAFGRVPVVRAVTVAPSAATRSYLAIKNERAAEAGMTLEVVALPETASTEEVVAAVTKEGADAVIVQLPLPASIDSAAVLAHIPRAQDVDVLSQEAYEAFVAGEPDALVPPVAGAVAEILERTHTSIEGKSVVVVGRGKLVGQPVAAWCMHHGVTPHILGKESDTAVLREADIIVSGAGQAGFITPDMLKRGVVLIDAGTSESNGALAGDARPSCAEVASVFTPVPGGVGPIAVACLFKNVATILSKSA